MRREPPPIQLHQHRVNVPTRLVRYSNSQPYSNGNRWQACALRLFMRRVGACELEQTVYGIVNDAKVAFWRESTETVWLFVDNVAMKSRERLGWAAQVAWVREVLG